MLDALPSEPPLRVVIVDADDRTRESLMGLLSIGDRLTVVGAAGQPASALDLVATAQPDVVVVDPRLPEVDSGIAFIGRLRAVAPGVRILAMSWSDSLEHAAMTGGADGFIRKTFRPAELVAAIVAAGRPSAA
jgi:DNA-binding NarL/FixJ family response regulator